MRDHTVYLPPDTGDTPALAPAGQTGTRFTYSVGIEGGVDVGVGLLVYTEMVYLPAGSHLSKL